MNHDPVLMLRRHVAAMRDDAIAFDLIAAKFRPAFEACWERDAEGKMGRMIDQERALQLQAMVLDNERNAKYNRDLADIIEPLIPSDQQGNSGGLRMTTYNEAQLERRRKDGREANIPDDVMLTAERAHNTFDDDLTLVIAKAIMAERARLTNDATAAFITANSGNGEYWIKIKCHTMAEMNGWHNTVCQLMNIRPRP